MISDDELGSLDLSEEEVTALSILRSLGWVVAISPYIEDCFGSDDALEEGRHCIAICKPNAS